MGRPRWGAAVCLDCRETLVGYCPTCTQARIAARRPITPEEREAYNASQRARRRYRRELEERRQLRQEGQE